MRQPHSTRQEILQEYKQIIESQVATQKKLKREKTFIAIARLVVTLIGLGTSWYLWPRGLPFSLSLFCFTAVLIWLIFRDADKTEEIKNCERLIQINQHEVLTMSGDLRRSGFDDGSSYADAFHPYASDLDLFGPSSLFQYLNRCHAEQAKKRLADMLKAPLPVFTIKEKQIAVKELASKRNSCQKFQSLAMANPLSFNTERRLKHWLDQPAGDFGNTGWKWIQWIYPVITLSLLTFCLLGYLTTNLFLECWVIFIACSYFISSRINPIYDMLSRIQPEINSLDGQLHLLEDEPFSADFLKSLQKRLETAGGVTASLSIRALRTNLKKFEYRMNWLVFLFLNSFLLWDLRQAIALADWKKKNRSFVSEWFEVIVEMEVSISLASLARNEPDWVFPEVDDHPFHLEGLGIGHPLIPAGKRVTNDFSFEGLGRVALITGSNMAGKSTFLRSLGIDIVLGQLGSPVCARQLKMSWIKLVSSMRVADNLAENTSTFFAELKKLEYIVEMVNHQEPALILLDEVLRGTNSSDRHQGTQALVKQLIRQKGVAIMATHDTELAHKEAQNPSVSNFHFEGRILDNELHFDYKIRNGICETFNATTLMKKIGIHFDD